MARYDVTAPETRRRWPEEVERPVAAVVQVVTALLGLLVVAGGIRSFMEARRR